MLLSRRHLLSGLAATVVPLSTPADAASTVYVGGASPAPDLRVDKDGWTVLEARASTLRLRPAPASDTVVWTFDGRVPGPLLRVKKGEEIKVRLVNGLSQPTSLCWHGVRVPNAMDGVAGLTQKAVAPGERFEYRFVPPDSGLFWYHPHAWPVSAEQIDRGLYGALIVDEPDPPAVDHDVLVVLDDWALDDHGQVRANAPGAGPASFGGVGSLLTANSTVVPTQMTFRPGARVRLRLLSALGSRIMIASFEGIRPLVQAIDGQPCEIFEPVHGTMPIGPGSRFDVMLDVPEVATASPARLVLRGDGEPDRDLLVLTTSGERLKPRPPITALPPNTALPARIPLERALKMNLVFEGGPKAATNGSKEPAKAAGPATVAPWTINGVGSDGFSGKPLFSVRRGSAVSLGLVNKAASAQQIHIHGHAVRLLHDLDDGWEPYWRESVLVAAEHTKHVAFVADNPGRWTIESLMLDRQVSGLAAWFEVT